MSQFTFLSIRLYNVLFDFPRPQGLLFHKSQSVILGSQPGRSSSMKEKSTESCDNFVLEVRLRVFHTNVSKGFGGQKL